MDLMQIRRQMIGVIAGMAKNIQTGTFVGNGSHSIDIPCPFEPDLVSVFCEDIPTNPGLTDGGLISSFLWRDGVYNNFRYTNATSGATAGGLVRNPVMDYNNGVYTFYNQASATNKSFFLYNGYTYQYALVKL